MDDFEGLYEDPYAVKRIQKSVELLRAESGQTIIDVGCYRQEAKKYLPEGIVYYGLDNLDIEGVLQVDLNRGFLAKKKVDRILCLETLEHLVYPRACLSSIKNALKDDGICVISLPNECTIFHRLSALMGTLDRAAWSEKGKHLHLPSLSQSRRFLQEDFQIVSVSPYISKGAGTTSRLARLLAHLIPDLVLRLLAKVSPSLFSRGFIFVCKPKP